LKKDSITTNLASNDVIGTWMNRIRGWFPQEPTLPKHLKIKLESHKRNWFPKDPLIAAIKSTEDEKFNRWALCPFLTPGALMSLSALLSGLFGLLFIGILLLNELPSADGVAFISSNFITGILSVGAFVVGFISGILLLANRSIVKAVAFMYVTFFLGIAILAIPLLLDIGSLEGGLVVAGQMIGLSTTALISLGLNYRKLKNSLITNENKLSKTYQTTIQAVQDSAL
jgi:hypothetical protein